MKSIFLLTNIYDDNIEIGITKKVHQQIEALLSLGFDKICYTSYFNDGIGVIDFNSREIIYKEKYKMAANLRNVTKNYELKRMAYNYLNAIGIQFDFVYCRYIFFDQLFLKFLKIAKCNSNKIILEAHSFPIYSKHDFMMYPIYLMDRLYRNKCSRYIDCVAAISDRKNIFGINTVSIDNGINQSLYPLKKSKIKSNEIILVFVGYEYNVHGLDRLLKGLKNYCLEKKDYTIKLYLVGKLLSSTRKKIIKYNLQKYVIITGVLSGDELDRIFDQADIGIGGLAPYRRNSHIGTGLKTKEYFARGLPVCIAGRSLTFNSCCKYILEIPNNSSPVNIDELVTFYESLYESKDFNKEIKKMSKMSTWERQMGKIFEELK